MPTQSVFVATTFSPDGNNLLSQRAQTIVDLLPNNSVTITPPENWHMTWRYYGEQTSDQINQIIQTLERVPTKHPRTLKTTTISTLPSPRTARVIVWNIRIPRSLAHTHARLETHARLQDRPAHWTAHITIARVKESFQKDPTFLNATTHSDIVLAKLPNVKPETFGLFTSTQTADGVRHYQPLWTRPAR